MKDNELIYDESKVEVTAKNTRSGHPISLAHCPQGKTDHFYFSRLYLDIEDKCGVIIDEPELSLSIDWQTKFPADIINSNKCEFLVAATHSPFIFDNELDSIASDMKIELQFDL